MAGSHETTTNAASVENVSNSLATGTEFNLYTSNFSTTVGSFPGIVRTAEEDEANAA